MAGGSGSRMKSKVPKQFLEIEGEPVIVKTIRKFIRTDSSIRIIVVLSEKDFSIWSDIKNRFDFVRNIAVVKGGTSRTDSVKSGLSELPEEGLVAVHDAVRPYIDTESIQRSFSKAKERGCGVVAVALKDSIREIKTTGESTARDRKDFVLVQTPQTFQINLLKKAYKKVGGAYSDDATVFEKAGYPVFLVEGLYSNIKITTPEDLRTQ